MGENVSSGPFAPEKIEDCPFCGAPGVKTARYGVLQWGCGTVSGAFGVFPSDTCKLWQRGSAVVRT